MIWQLCAVAALIALAVLFAKRFASWLVFYVISKALRCNFVKFSHVGIFSVTDLKIRFDAFTLSVDKIWLSSSFFNQAYTKPIVVCFGDVRLEGHKPTVAAKRSRAAPPTAPAAQNETVKSALVAKIRQFSWLLQYVATTVNNLDIVLLDILLPGCLVHLAVEQIDLDTFRDRENIQLDICWKVLNFKLLQRSDTEDQAKELLQIAAEARFTFYFRPSDFYLTSISLKITNPIAKISDAITNIFAKNRLDTEIDTPGKNEETDPEIRSDDTASRFSLEQFNVHCTSASISLSTTAYNGNLQLSVKSITLNGSVKDGVQRAKLDISDALLADHNNSGINISAVDSELEIIDKDICVRSYTENVTGYFNEDSVLFWHQYRLLKDENINVNKRREDSGKSSFFEERRTHINFELACFSCKFLPPSRQVHYLSVGFASFSRDGETGAYELSVDSFGITTIDPAKCTPVEEGPINEHQCGNILYVRVFLLQVERIGLSEKRIRLQLDQLQFEWCPSLAQSLSRLLPIRNETKETEKSKNKNESTLLLHAKLSDVGIYLSVDTKTYVYLLCRSLRVEKTENNILLSMHGFQAARQALQAKKKLFLLSENNAALSYDSSIVEHAKIVFEKNENVISVQCGEGIVFSWSPILHCICKTLGDDVRELFLKNDDKSSQKISDDTRTDMEIRVNFLKNNRFNVVLPGDHTIVFTAAGLKFRKRGSHAIVAETTCLNVTIDENPIFSFEAVRVEKMRNHISIMESRQLTKNLLTTENPVWVTTIGKVQTVFPYGYDFGQVYEEVSGVIKWLKLLHVKTKTPFTVDSPLPPDLMFFVEDFIFELSDDLFEVRLRDNYLLLMDEYLESERRLQMLETKLDDLRKVCPLLPRAKVQELHASLLKKNSDIYVERSKKSYGAKPSRTHLFRWNMKNVCVKAIADLLLHGEENATQHIRNMDSESPWPNSTEFNTLWCRIFEFDFGEWLMTMRDYPQPYASMTDGHLWGKLAGAEPEGNERAKRRTVLDLGAPFEKFYISRNMPPLKFYYDLCSEIKSVKCSYGPCWEPCLAMINICFDKINKPSLDPSPSLPFWDKIRLLFHGRLSMACDNFITVLLASSDPYNTTEQMEWMWSNLQFDWTNGRIVVQSDLDVYIRTASKYDDCRLLHLPNVRLQTKFYWSCIGDPNDHHSVVPCAPDKLPDYSVHKEHDSYRAFRSQHLDVGLSLNITPSFVASDGQCPQMLLYANTFRWLDGLKNTISAVHRPIRRGPLFKNSRQQKLQLSRHYRQLQISLSVPKFIILYWYSYSTDRGVKIVGQAVQLSAAYQLAFQPRRDAGRLSRRDHATLQILYMNAELVDAEMYLFSELPTISKEGIESFFISVHRWTYCRESLPEKQSTGDLAIKPTHKVVIHDFKGAWTSSNRDVVLFILDGIQKARVLRRNLSAAALKRWQVSEEHPDRPKMRKSVSSGPVTESTSPAGRVDGNYATNLLEQLIAEADTKFMAFSETSEISSQQLHGIALSQMDDELYTKWHIELVNSQVVLKGCETGGYVLCTAAKAQVTQRVHVPVWRENQLLGKVTWVAMLNGMQYYATLGTKDSASTSRVCNLDDVKWLSKELIEERSCSDQSLDVVESFCSKGEAAGGVVADITPSESSPQLQRIVSRCSCQLYFCHFTDSVEMEECGELPPLPVDTGEAFLHKMEFVDCFTLKHNTLNISTNPLQYQMILDIVNNLILYVDPKQKESAEKLVRYRFQLQLQSVEDLRPNILRLQDEVRQLLNEQRYLERQIYYIYKQTEKDKELLQQHQDEIEQVKTELASKSDDLAMTISCFREKQVQRHHSALARVSDDQQAPIARRFEVCFEDAQWRLTAVDGQLGLSDFQIRNYLYTRISRINDSGEHLLEVGFVKITNLLPNSPYRDVLQMQGKNGIPNDRQPAIRVVCRELAPVGGISVKAHFEVNVVPMVVQISYVYFRTMMNYFFPDRNIDSEDQQNLDNGFDHVETEKSKTSVSTQSKPIKSGARKRREKHQTEDDVDKMKQRAEKNNVFLYIKIPEVPFLVSYKGEKEKNIEDVENFQLEFPLVEYHDRSWTWLDLALAIKQRCKRVLLHQFMKQKLLRSRLGAAFGNNQPQTDPLNLPEEEKARLLLGSLGTPEKTSKKSYPLHKSNKM